MKPLLIEIGTEEIPARFIPGGMRSLKEGIEKLLDDNRIDFDGTHEYGTPRRLSVFIENVSERQKGRTVEVLGPPKKIGMDAKGNFTSAAAGFARSQKIDISNLCVTTTDRGEYISATVNEPANDTVDVLAETLPKLISSLPFPKSMRWGSGSLKFVRPIHWITSVFGETIIPLEIDGIKGGSITRGHRFMSPGAFKINDISSYLHLLSNNLVIADPGKRKDLILKGIREIETANNCRVIADSELLDTVTFLVEYPTVVLGNFDPEYLSLPRELPVTVMKIHQKYFSVEGSNNELLPHFVLVSNTDRKNNPTVRKGAERVLKARLEDARFYFDADRKIPLGDFIESLKSVTFQEKLGSLYEKAGRISSICSTLSESLGLTGLKKIQRAAMLSKADLVSGVVREFPELQGYMGMIYANISGEEKDIADAIFEHYLPRFTADRLPSGDIGTIVSLADKIDNIASFFSVGLMPTGSEDPFALRRQSIGIINILQDKNYDLSLEALIDAALECVSGHSPSDTLKTDIIEFFNQRLDGIFLNEGFDYDLVNAVLPGRNRESTGQNESIKKIKNRLKILSEMRKGPEFSHLLTAAKRVYNIISNADPSALNVDLLTEPAEQELFSAVKSVQIKLDNSYDALYELTTPINTFFDSVLVMDKNSDVRQNRLALLCSVMALFDRLGNFPEIVD